MTNAVIKQYDKQPSKKQREAMMYAFRASAMYHLLAGDTVIVQTSDYFGDSSLLASLIINCKVLSCRKVGKNGGLTVLGNY